MQMRKTLAISPYLGAIISVLGGACGGGQAAAPPAAQPGESAAAATAGNEDAGAPHEPTTTLLLSDAGELKGVKLAEVHSDATALPSDAGTPGGGHSHDPGRTLADIKAIIASHRDAARACYDKGLANHPGVEGTLAIQWTIDPKGNVTTTSLDESRSTITEPSIVDCVGAVIKKIQFAPSQGGFESKASYPFTFHPHGAERHHAE
jgi:hypothetical protein